MLHYGIMLMTAYEDGLPLEMEGTEEDKYLERYLDCILFGARFRLGGVGTCAYIQCVYRTQPERISMSCGLLGLR
jgi:hypothetical protein